jgi:hypothetical protein
MRGFRRRHWNENAEKIRAYVRYRADLFLVIRIKRRMATVLYHCPNTGFRVQGYTEGETIAPDHDGYVPVTCLACKLVHLVNAKTGKVLGEASR